MAPRDVLHSLLLLIPFTLISCPENLLAQNNMVLDSLTRVLKSTQEDETKMNTLRDLYWELERANPEQARVYIERSIAIAEKLNNVKGIAQGKYAFSGYYEMKGTYEVAIKLLNESLTAFQQMKDTLMINNCLLDIGQSYHLWRQYKEALEFILQAIDGYEKAHMESPLARAYNSLANLYKAQGKFEDALNAYKKALQLCEAYNISQGIPVCENNIGIIQHDLENYDQALVHYQRAIKLYENMGNKLGVAKVNNNIGLTYTKLDNFSKALSYHLKAQLLYEELKHTEGIAIANVNIGYDYSNLGDTKQSLEHYNKSLAISQKYHYDDLTSQVYTNLSTLYAQLGDYKNAHEFQVKYKSLDDTLTARKNDEYILELETEFESKQKEKQISILQKENEIKGLKLNRTRALSLVGAICTLLAGISIYFFFKNYRHRRNLQEMERLRASDQKLLDVKQELIRAVVDTEEKERKRISADLHDEMGPLLSGLRLYLGEIEDTKGNEQNEMIASALEIVDEAIKELRHISQNLLPTNISERGLVGALKLFFEKIRATKTIDIEFQSQLKKLKLNQAEELILYRVITELTNNTLKHAEAKKITLDLEEKDQNIQIDYQDDGTGFDTESLSNNVGMGIKNIQERIQSLDGIVDIDSDINKGTNVKILIHTNH